METRGGIPADMTSAPPGFAAKGLGKGSGDFGSGGSGASGSEQSPSGGASSPSGEFSSKVYFRMAQSEVKFGDFIKVVGDHPSLGAWDPNDGIQLKTETDRFPIWYTE